MLILLTACGDFICSVGTCHGSGPEPTALPASEGTQTAPVVVNYPGGLPLEGIVAQTPSYYRIAGLAAGNEYELSMFHHGSRVTFQPFQDAFINPVTCFATETDEERLALFRCGFTATGDSVWLKTTNLDASSAILIHPASSLPPDYFHGYDLQVKQIAPPRAEGSISSPVLLQPRPYMTDVSYRGTVNNGSSYYRISGLNSGPSFPYYFVSLFEMTADVDLFVYSDAFTSPISCVSTVKAGTLGEFCSVVPSGQTVWAEVRIPAGTTGLSRGPTFTLHVGPGG